MSSLATCVLTYDGRPARWFITDDDRHRQHLTPYRTASEGDTSDLGEWEWWSTMSLLSAGCNPGTPDEVIRRQMSLAARLRFLTRAP